MVIFFAAFVPSVINTFTGVRAIEPPLIEAARMLGTGRLALHPAKCWCRLPHR